ncbi:hypothetical protein STEG23_025590, partial [Scotinomys teguina]
CHVHHRLRESISDLLGLGDIWAVRGISSCCTSGFAGHQPSRCQVDNPPPTAAAVPAGCLNPGLGGLFHPPGPRTRLYWILPRTAGTQHSAGLQPRGVFLHCVRGVLPGSH